MKEKIQNWLHDLGVALGLIEPPLQPVPIRTDDEQRRPRRRSVVKRSRDPVARALHRGAFNRACSIPCYSSAAVVHFVLPAII